MDKQDVEYRMYSLKSFCEIFDGLFSYDTGDDFWKRCVCEATIRSVSVDMCDGEVNQRPEEVSLRIALKDVVLRRLEPYKDLKPKSINTNKIKEMLQHTIKVFMDDETMKVEVWTEKRYITYVDASSSCYPRGVRSHTPSITVNF